MIPSQREKRPCFKRIVLCVFPSAEAAMVQWPTVGAGDAPSKSSVLGSAATCSAAAAHAGVISSRCIFLEICFSCRLLWGSCCNLHVAGFSCLTAALWLCWVCSQQTPAAGKVLGGTHLPFACLWSIQTEACLQRSGDGCQIAGWCVNASFCSKVSCHIYVPCMSEAAQSSYKSNGLRCWYVPPLYKIPLSFSYKVWNPFSTPARDISSLMCRGGGYLSGRSPGP